MTRPATLETYLGRYVDYNNPRPEDICLTDVARQLAHTCRFAGAVSRFYSVAEHAILVRNLVIDAGHPELALAALHHDSHEAYLGDWPTPLKLAVGATALNELQAKFDVAIAKAFTIDVNTFTSHVVKMTDHEALLREAASLKPSRGVGEHWSNYEARAPIAGAGLPPEYAERLFVQAHYAKFGERV
jgi:5'-deoxynucleotidase YfbR-like HD superfamily hydrolase